MTKYCAQPRNAKDAPSLGEAVAIAKAIGDERRMRVLALLRTGELCLCQIIEILGLAPSTVSKHMSILRQAGLVEQRKDGRWHFYRLVNGRESGPVVRQALRWVMNSLSDDPSIAADAQQLSKLCRMKPEEWTNCYRSGSSPVSERGAAS